MTYLYRPPPISGMHLVVNPARPSFISIVTLRGKHKVVHKPRVPIETPDAWYDLPKIQLLALTINDEFLALECRASGEGLVNNLVKLIDIAIREP